MDVTTIEIEKIVKEDAYQIIASHEELLTVCAVLRAVLRRTNADFIREAYMDVFDLAEAPDNVSDIIVDMFEKLSYMLCVGEGFIGGSVDVE